MNLIHLSIKITTPHQSGAPFVSERVFQNRGVCGQAFPLSPHHPLIEFLLSLQFTRDQNSEKLLLMERLLRGLLLILPKKLFETHLCLFLQLRCSAPLFAFQTALFDSYFANFPRQNRIFKPSIPLFLLSQKQVFTKLPQTKQRVIPSANLMPSNFVKPRQNQV